MSDKSSIKSVLSLRRAQFGDKGACPPNEFIVANVRTLAQAYKERPVTLFRVIYALRDQQTDSQSAAALVPVGRVTEIRHGLAQLADLTNALCGANICTTL